MSRLVKIFSARKNPENPRGKISAARGGKISAAVERGKFAQIFGRPAKKLFQRRRRGTRHCQLPSAFDPAC